MNSLEIVRNVAARMTDSDLRAILNSTTVHENAKRFTGRALEGLSEMVVACCEEVQNREALRATYSTGGCD